MNRDLSKVIMIDCDAKATTGYERNTIVLKKWEGDPSDRTLLDLTPLLLGRYCHLLLIVMVAVVMNMMVVTGDDGADDGGGMMTVMMMVMMRISKNCSLYNVIIAAIFNDLRFPTHIILIGLNHNTMQMLNHAER